MSDRYQPGQLWRYHARPGEDASRMTVLCVDSHSKLGSIIHVALSGLVITNFDAPSGLTTEIIHLPFSEEAIDRSVLEPDGFGDLPDFNEGYGVWREAFERGDAGVFTITVAEAVEVMDRAINSGE